MVLAIGNPFGIGQTVTTGIVSAKGRGNMGLDYEDFIQTDAAINPGNSGGALVDADGRLIGINTAILSRSGGNQGIGFAIPVNLARDVMDSLIKDGHVTRGYLGVMIQDLTPALAKEFKLKDTTGALVGDVTPERPGGQSRPQERRRHRRVQWQEGHRQPPPQAGSGPHQARRDRAGEGPARRRSKTLEVTVKECPAPRHSPRATRHSRRHRHASTAWASATSMSKPAQQFEVPENVKGAVVTEVEARLRRRRGRPEARRCDPGNQSQAGQERRRSRAA